MTDQEVAIVVTLVVYKAVLIGLGFVANKQTQTGEDYFLGGRGLGPLVAAISASASSSSAWTLLGVSGAAYAWGLSAIWLLPACVGGFVLNWYGLAPRLWRLSHESGGLTVTEILAKDAGKLRKAIGISASVIIIVSLMTYVASQFQGAGKTFNETFGMSLESSVILGSTIVVFYTWLGGFWAVSLTDTLQGLMMAATSVILPIAAIIAVGGPGALWDGMMAADVPGYSSLVGTRDAWPGLLFIIGILGVGLGYPGQPHVVNRFMAMRNDPATLRSAQRIAVAWSLAVYVGMLILGWAGRLLFTEVADKEVVFIVATHELFPPIISGIMLAAVLSAIMSTADSQLLVVASTVSHDLGWGSDDPKRMVQRSRWVVAALSACAVVLAIWGPTEIFSYVLFAWAAMGCAFGPPLLVRTIRGPIEARFLLAAILVGFTTSVAAYSIPAAKGGVMERVVPFILSLALSYWGAREQTKDETS